MSRGRFEANTSSSPVTADAVRAVCAEVLRPAHFFLAEGLTLKGEHVAAEVDRWEVFQGRLLDRPYTRQQKTFAAWNVFLADGQERSGEPLLALKLDEAAGELHVLRGVEAYVHEGFDAGGGVIETRERRRWVRELAGTVRLSEFAAAGELRDEVACRLFRAVVGASRLPLHSVEAPLPAFSFGKLFYRYGPDVAPDAGPLRTAAELADSLAQSWSPVEYAKLLETCLHAADVAAVAARFATRWAALGRTGEDLVRLLRTLFNEVSLTPWTGIAERTLAFLAAWESTAVLRDDQVTDFLAHLLRQAGRHLTAYDLETFHHRGANYPDALLLDAVLRAYLACINRQPAAFTAAPADDDTTAARKRLRRRALRQGWLLRRRYEGHPVPDAPTSPGEHARVLPPEYPRVPEEQLLQPARRKKQLYAGDPLLLGAGGDAVLRDSVADLDHPDELRELGLALYLDRPLGDAKAPAEPDATPLLASEAFSPSLAAGRLATLVREGLLSEGDRAALAARLREPAIGGGLPLEAIGVPRRPGTVALTDARMAAGDFVFRRTVPGAVRALLEAFDFAPLAARFDLAWLTAGRPVLVTRSPRGTIAAYDENCRQRLELALAQGGYTNRGGVEYPAGGLLAVRVWEEGGAGLVEHDVRQGPILLAVRFVGTSGRARSIEKGGRRDHGR
jgi:hypothetical protein